MRRGLAVLFLATVTVLAGCGGNSLQDEVDAANRRQLAQSPNRSLLLMSWDNEPKEWLLVSDLTAAAGGLHAMLTFHQGRVSISSRAAILEEEEITNPGQGSGFRENPAARRERYEKTRSLVAKGQKWTGESQTTSISPYAVDYREAGSLEFRDLEVQLLVGEVLSPRSRDPMSIYEFAQVVVGLDAATGDLVFEYLINLRPKAEAANRMLVVHDGPPLISLGTMAERSAEERLNTYLRIYTELHALDRALNGRFPLTAG